MSDVVLAEDAAVHVRLIKLNRPEQLNAINTELCTALHQELERAAADRSCRVIVRDGRGPWLLRRPGPSRIRAGAGK